MAWVTTKGWLFRHSSAYVTNPTNTTDVIGTQNSNFTHGEAYPTTRSIGGENVTYGWDTLSNDIENSEHSTSPPVELAGSHFLNANSTHYFRVDVPAAGNYRFQCAIGRRNGSDCTANLLVKDGVGGSTLVTIQDSNVTFGEYYDSAGTKHANAATWDASGRVWTNFTLSGTSVIFELTKDATYTNPTIAYILLEQLSSGAPLLLLNNDMDNMGQM